ncbi:MAG: energy-coupling factor transporter transmembrane component T, partial [Dehalococcoidia bacterium]
MHTIAWVAWVMLVMTVALITNNPYYLAIVFLSVILVAVLAPKTGTGVAGFRALLVLGLGLFAVSMGIAVINGNFGDHILFTLPGPELPEWLGGLRLGGPVSAEGLVAAAIRGLAILTVLLAFGVFNGAVSPHRVLKTAPAALFHAGLVVTVGLTLLPSTIEDTRRIREMRALRGARTGLRELPALVVPSVINGLERSMRLAEAMEARGYAASEPAQRGRQLMGAVSVPLLIAAAWGWYYYAWAQPIAIVVAAAGVPA